MQHRVLGCKYVKSLFLEKVHRAPCLATGGLSLSRQTCPNHQGGGSGSVPSRGVSLRSPRPDRPGAYTPQPARGPCSVGLWEEPRRRPAFSSGPVFRHWITGVAPGVGGELAAPGTQTQTSYSRHHLYSYPTCHQRGCRDRAQSPTAWPLELCLWLLPVEPDRGAQAQPAL